MQSQAPDSLPDFSSYHILVYDPHNSSSGDTQAAMAVLGITNYTLRTSVNPVTLADLNTHDILIVGWNSGGNNSGLSAGVLAAGITGRVFLTGHDLDYHIVHGPLAARTLFLQALQFVLDGKGTGMIGLTDPTALFSWIPAAWGVQASQDGGEYVTTITEDALVWDIYDGLVANSENPDIRLSRWGTSYHTQFSLHNSRFVPFELGGSSGQEIVTVANFNIPGLDFEKTVNSDPNTLPCVDVWGEAEFTISYTYSDDPNHTRQPLTEVRLVDYIPPDADYVSSSPMGTYDIFTRTVTWELGTLYPGSSGSVTIRLRVNENSEPSGVVVNTTELIAEDIVLARTHRSISVCCWGGDVIYVDDTATGVNTGTSWANAYTDLQAAIGRAEKGCGTQIWVAAGTYYPGTKTTDSFVIPAGVSVYGGFTGTETAIDQRNIRGVPTILSGHIGMYDDDSNPATPDVPKRNTTVVTMGNNTMLDGFIVTESNKEGQGILGKNIVNSTISNCITEYNQWYGIYTENSEIKIRDSIIRYNGYDGSYHRLGGTVLVDHCQIYDNFQNGISTVASTPSILNSAVFRNGFAGNSYYGISVIQPAGTTLIRNNTIVYNANEGVNAFGLDPTIRNSILWGNKAYGDHKQLRGNGIATYCLLADPNNLTLMTPDPNSHNISCNPQFAYADITLHNFHLLPTSPCIDRGNNAGIAAEETDMDGATRIDNDIVDIGADEVDCSDVYHVKDLDGDGLVGLGDFGLFSWAWQSWDPYVLDPNCPDHTYYTGDPASPQHVEAADCIHWNARCNWASTGTSQYTIDLADLLVWLDEDWMWAACWRLDLMEQQSQMINATASLMSLEASLEEEWPAAILKDVTLQKTTSEQIIELQNVALFLETLWLSDPQLQQDIDADAWDRFMNEINQSLKALKTTPKTFTQSEEVQ
ncbi:right-handed parallel beta-helix repeat-containing protein [Anaerohalosphaeraceae bacterium U12dextr]